MNVFHQLVYEYQKGLRDLCLHTCSSEHENKMEALLKRQGISYLICPLLGNKVNVFFGMPECIEIIKKIGCQELNKLSDEEDFILGMMLGYGKHQQYQRFLSRKKCCA